jgi:hypothetical protein
MYLKWIQNKYLVWVVITGSSFIVGFHSSPRYMLIITSFDTLFQFIIHNHPSNLRKLSYTADFALLRTPAVSHFKTEKTKFTVFWDVAPCSLIGVDRRFRGAYCHHALMMEAVSTSETSVHSNATTRCYIPEDCKLHTRRRENLKTHWEDSFCRRYFSLKKSSGTPFRYASFWEETSGTAFRRVRHRNTPGFYWYLTRKSPQTSIQQHNMNIMIFNVCKHNFGSNLLHLLGVLYVSA